MPGIGGVTAASAAENGAARATIAAISRGGRFAKRLAGGIGEVPKLRLAGSIERGRQTWKLELFLEFVRVGECAGETCSLEAALYDCAADADLHPRFMIALQMPTSIRARIA